MKVEQVRIPFMELKQGIELIADEKEHIDTSEAFPGIENRLFLDVTSVLCFILRIKGMNAEIIPPDFPISPAPILTTTKLSAFQLLMGVNLFELGLSARDAAKTGRC